MHPSEESLNERQQANILSEELLVAVKARNLNRVRQLLDQGAEVVFWKDADGKNIYSYIRNTNEPVWRLVDQAWRKQWRAMLNQDLIYAARDGDIASVRDLIQQGAGVNTQDLRLSTPLHHAVEQGRAEVVQALIAAQANLDLGDACCSNSPLHVAYYRHDWQTFKLLVQAGADVNHRNRFGNSLLQLAALDGNEEIVKLLIDAKADVNAKDKAGFTPLSTAANTNIYNLLIAAGAVGDAKSQPRGTDPD